MKFIRAWEIPMALSMRGQQKDLGRKTLIQVETGA
jgi:hypothetical protein